MTSCIVGALLWWCKLFKKMSNVKTLLLLSSTQSDCSFSILFHCARFWAQQGSRVLFISETPLKNLPVNVGKVESFANPDGFKLIQFMYLASWEDLVKQLFSIHLRHNPVSVIIVKNLENYFKSDKGIQNQQSHVSLICASLLNAVSTCAKIVSQPAVLINDYMSEDSKIEKTVIKNFFANVWELKNFKGVDDRTYVKLSKLVFNDDEVAEFLFSEEAADSELRFVDIVKKIL